MAMNVPHGAQHGLPSRLFRFFFWYLRASLRVPTAKGPASRRMLSSCCEVMTRHMVTALGGIVRGTSRRILVDLLFCNLVVAGAEASVLPPESRSGSTLACGITDKMLKGGGREVVDAARAR